MAIEVRKASRKKVRARIGLSAAAGGGKTMSALLIGYGLVGDWSKIGLVDTEAGSGELYVNHRVPGTAMDIGEYWYVRLEPPFTVLKYMEAQKALEDADCEVIILDSISHAWSGQGGLLDQVNRISAGSNSNNSYTAWRDVTPQHNRFIDGMLQSPAHIIATMRSKTEYVMETNKRGKLEPKKVGMAPVQREGMDYEFTVVLDIDATHTAHASKDRTSLFDNEYFIPGPATGQKMLAWLNTGADAPPPQARQEQAPKQEPKTEQRKPSIPEWLEALQIALNDAVRQRDPDGVDAIIARADVQKAFDMLKGADLQRLQTMTRDAIAATDEEEVGTGGESGEPASSNGEANREPPISNREPPIANGQPAISEDEENARWPGVAPEGEPATAEAGAV